MDHSTLWAGIDTAKDKFDAALSAQGPCATFPRSREGACAFLDWWSQHLPDSTVSRRVVMESTGPYSIQLAQWLRELVPSTQPAIINPMLANAFGRSLGLRNKTDRVDARTLAHYGAERSPAAYQPLDEDIAQLRELIRERAELVEIITARRNRLGMNAEDSPATKFLCQSINDCQSLLKKLERRIKKLIANSPRLSGAVARLDSIPGVAWLSASVILAELGDLRRFSTSRMMSAFAGLSPRQNNSGKHIGRTRMCKQGSPRVRQILYLCAMAAVRRPTNGFARIYQRLRSQAKPPMAALGTIMRKMLVTMRALLRTDSDYNDALM